jgi:hypothetical protein
VLAWGLLGVQLALLATLPWLDHLNRAAGRPDVYVLGLFAIPPTVAALTAGIVGAVLASRRPGTRSAGCCWPWASTCLSARSPSATSPTGWSSAPGRSRRPTSSPRVYPVTIAVVLAIVGFILLLTPTGSPPSPRWRRLAALAAVAVVVSLVAATVAPGSLDPLAQYVSGPLDPQVYGGALRVALQLALLAGLLTILVGAASLVARFRRARGVERLQLKWVALAAALTGLSMLAAAVLIAVGEVNLGAWASVVGATFLPLATGAAILRYGCTIWTGSSAAPWPTGCSPCCWVAATPWWCWDWASCSARTPAWSWPRPPWPWRRRSSRPAAASNRPSTGASTGAATTPPGSSSGSAAGCATRSTWTP